LIESENEGNEHDRAQDANNGCNISAAVHGQDGMNFHIELFLCFVGLINAKSKNDGSATSRQNIPGDRRSNANGHNDQNRRDDFLRHLRRKLRDT